MDRIKLSSKGQIVIPKRLRDRYLWRTGTELAVRDTGKGVALELVKSGKRVNVADLAGCLKHRGRRISVEMMNGAVAAALRSKR